MHRLEANFDLIIAGTQIPPKAVSLVSLSQSWKPPEGGCRKGFNNSWLMYFAMNNTVYPFADIEFVDSDRLYRGVDIVLHCAGTRPTPKEDAPQSPPKGYPKSRSRYADPTNFKYPIDTEEHVRAAWSYVNQKRNRKDYSAEELAYIEARIKSAAKKLGIKIEDDDDSAKTMAHVTSVGLGACSLSGGPARVMAVGVLRRGVETPVYVYEALYRGLLGQIAN